MKTFNIIREDLRNIRYYYSRKDQLNKSAEIIGECKIHSLVDEYNNAICQAPPKLYDLYVCIYVENNTQESAAKQFGYAREHITRLNKQLLRFLQNHLAA